MGRTNTKLKGETEKKRIKRRSREGFFSLRTLGQLLGAIALVLCFLGLIWLIPVLSPMIPDTLPQTLGLGLVLLILWVGAVVLIAWRRRLVRRWSYWLAAVLFTLAGLELLSFFSLEGLDIANTSLAAVIAWDTLSQVITSKQPVYALLRLGMLGIAGVVLIAPNQTRRLAPRSMVWLFHQLWGVTSSLGGGVFMGGRHVLSSLAGSLTRLSHRPQRPMTQARQPKVETGEHLAGEKIGGKPLPAAQEVKLEKASPALEADQRQLQEVAQEIGERQPVPSRSVGSLQLPPISLLDQVSETKFGLADNEKRAGLIEDALASYGVEAKVVQISPGPTVTQFGIEPGWDRKYRKVTAREQDGKAKLDKDGNPEIHSEEVSRTRVKVDRITSLANDLALSLAAPSIRIEAPVPGTSVIGIEVPNATTSLVNLRSVIESSAFQRLHAKSKLALALGKGAAGKAVVGDLAKMPHLLIAGATGSGKTVCINAIVTCLLMHATPEEIRLLMIDPKRVEMVGFSNLPHLLSPVVVDVDEAIGTLRRITREMDSRYRKMASVSARHIEAYNRSPRVTEPLPSLVVIIDELADLMMKVSDVVEPLICRIAQIGRATGIHLIIATQRPSVDVVTGLIKANFPARISFAVASHIDSRTILDTGGAEKLLGEGDMLYLPADAEKPKRLRGSFVSDQEIERVVNFWRYWRDVYSSQDNVTQRFASLDSREISEEDPLLETARHLAAQHTRISTSLLQRRLHIGYPRAARLVDLLEQEGIVGPGESGRSREVLVAPKLEENGEEPG